MAVLLKLIVISLLLVVTNGTLSPSDTQKKGKKVKEIKVKTGKVSSSVFDRQLIDEEPLSKDILVENGAYYEDTSTKMFNGTVLGYVTPWNNHGYDVAKIWGAKFNYISPVWLQILRKGPKNYELGGTHDIDIGWMKDVKTAGKSIKNKVVPRILFDKFTDKDYSSLLTFKEERDIVSKIILNTCNKYKFDGIVLEVWTALSARVEDEHLISLVTEICESLTQKKFDCILVVPPTRKQTYELFSRKHFETLAPFVTAFSMMTYDYSTVQHPGANAPIHWIREAVEHISPDKDQNRAKILLGLNFYGNDYTPNGGGPIIGHEFLNLLKNFKGRLEHSEHDIENYFEVRTGSGRHMVFYPTLYSINERLKLARDLGTGISIWEIGQGLDYFYDLF